MPVSKAVCPVVAENRPFGSASMIRDEKNSRVMGMPAWSHRKCYCPQGWLILGYMYESYLYEQVW